MMTPRLRLWLCSALAVALGVVISFGVADESYGLAGALAVLIAWLVGEWTRGPQPDAWVMSIAMLGYIVGNRGFAQISVLRTFPLLPAEAALLVCVPALILRWAFKRVPAMTSDPLNLAILTWIVVLGCRLPLDFQRYGFLAVRDFALVYYASFFFITQALCRHEPSRRLLGRALAVGFALLPFAVLGSALAEDFFLNTLAIRGVPLIFLKGDLAAAFLAGGFFYYWSWFEASRLRLWLIPASICLLTAPNVGSPRSAMVGALMATLAWLAARRWTLVGFQATVVAVALMIAIPVYTLMNRSLEETPLYSIYEHALSIVDFQGKGEYRHAETGDPGDNNRFRLVWWRTVTEETLATNPVFGLGFGADLSTRFLIEYNLIEAEDFNARSPHSVLMTSFGRTGFVGLLLFLTIAAMMARASWPAFREQEFIAMGLWSVAWVLWFSACFGVVLEGPMGAVVFWSTVGIAHERTKRLCVASASGREGDTVETAPPATTGATGR